MSRQVYFDGKQFERVSDLEAALFDAWDAIPHGTLVSLVRSMPRRCVEVVEKEGNKMHYRKQLVFSLFIIFLKICVG